MPTEFCISLKKCRLQLSFLPMHYWNDANVIKRFITEYPQYKSRIKDTECTKGEEII